MARTARDIITRSLRIVGVLGAGETASAEDAADSFVALNSMIDSWSIDRLFAYNIVQSSFPLTAGTARYSIGNGGTFNTIRPNEIEYAFARDVNNLDWQIDIITQEQYAAILLKNVGNTYPNVLWYDPEYPLAYVNLYPLPGVNLTLYLGIWSILTQFATLDTQISFPPGYEDAITFSLAERLGVEYRMPVGADAQQIALKARARVQGNNLVDARSVCEFGTGQSDMASFADFLAGR
jgi:hypothetical protein